MAKKPPEKPNTKALPPEEQGITFTLEKNYMPYAMSVILSRALPEIDGFKPSHRKLLYTMYKAGLLTGSRTKSANVVGATMKLNPHGDQTIYETMVRLSRGYEALLTPFVDSKGNFGKVYSRDMAYAASRYTEVKLDPICKELFADIDHDTVDFIDSYDGEMKEPTLLPTTYPNVLVSANQGIAVGMASMICGFNLAEVCNTAVEVIRDPFCDLSASLLAPDFPTGGEIVYDKEQMDEIYRTGRGSFKVRSRYRYDTAENVIEIYEIPYTTTVEAIIDKVADLVRQNKLREIADMRDETDLGGLKIAINLKKGVDPDALMQKLYAMTPLMDSFSCNFNILVAGVPRVMGVREILEEWTAFRFECVRRRIHFDLTKKREKLHLLKGLSKILLDIDRAIRVIRETEEESEVVPNLMIAFRIDKIQAEYIAEIKLRNINKEYILKRIAETEELEKEIGKLEAVLKDRQKVLNIIVAELKEVAKKYGAPRKTGIVYGAEVPKFDVEADIPDYPVQIFLSREGYFKKITPQSLRMSSEQKYKESDGLLQWLSGSNAEEIIFFSNRAKAYKCKLSEFDDLKASVLGDFLPVRFQMDDGETVLFMCLPREYRGHLLVFFENGKAAKVELSAYDTKSNRRKLTGAYSDRSAVVHMMLLPEDTELAVFSSAGRALLFNTASLTPKSTRTTIGVSVLSLKKGAVLSRVVPAEKSGFVTPSRFRVRTLPAAGAPVRPEDIGEVQLALDESGAEPSDGNPTD